MATVSKIAPIRMLLSKSKVYESLTCSLTLAFILCTCLSDSRPDALQTGLRQRQPRRVWCLLSPGRSGSIPPWTELWTENSSSADTVSVTGLWPFNMWHFVLCHVIQLTCGRSCCQGCHPCLCLWCHGWRSLPWWLDPGSKQWTGKQSSCGGAGGGRVKKAYTRFRLG